MKVSHACLLEVTRINRTWLSQAVGMYDPKSREQFVAQQPRQKNATAALIQALPCEPCVSCHMAFAAHALTCLTPAAPY
jgi:hypothetical protein